MKTKAIFTTIITLLGALNSQAATILTSGNIGDASSWDNELPSMTNTGTINSSSSGTYAWNDGAFTNVVVNMTGGTLGHDTTSRGTNSLRINGDTVFTMSGGTINGAITLGGGTTMVMSGGLIDNRGNDVRVAFAASTTYTGIGKRPSLTISGSAAIELGAEITNHVIYANYTSDWSGYITDETHTGTEWKTNVVAANVWYEGTAVTAANFDDFFEITNDGKTLSLIDSLIVPVPEPSSTLLLGIAGMAFILRKRK